jgi:hypothetical protein
MLYCSRVNGVLTELDGGLTGGHSGVSKTLYRAREMYYWLNAKKDIEKWC